jgi:diguanylate cyclase
MSSPQDTAATPEQSAELLRLTLPRMSRHGVPVTPHNYAVWYRFVEGSIPELTAEIQQMIDAGAPFTEQINETLFQKYIAECNIEQFQKIRSEMRDLMQDLGSSLQDAGQDAERFDGHLAGVVENVEQGASLADIKHLLESLIEETRTMRKSTQLLHEHLEAKSHEIQLLQEELEQERRRASTDPLTELANRRAFIETLQRASREVSSSHPLSLLMIDIDHFKNINDTHGHLIGDRVIRFLAQVLKQNTKGKDLAARYGGEEFVVMLGDTGLRGAEAVAESIRTAVADAKLVRSDNKQPLGRITISLGVTAYRPGEDPIDAINRADQALYQSKQNGRNRVTVDADLLGLSNEAG